MNRHYDLSNFQKRQIRYSHGNSRLLGYNHLDIVLWSYMKYIITCTIYCNDELKLLKCLYFQLFHLQSNL